MLSEEFQYLPSCGADYECSECQCCIAQGDCECIERVVQWGDSEASEFSLYCPYCGSLLDVIFD